MLRYYHLRRVINYLLHYFSVTLTKKELAEILLSQGMALDTVMSRWTKDQSLIYN